MRSLDDDRRLARVKVPEAPPRSRSRPRRLRMPWARARARGRLASAAGSSQVGALARYLGDLEEWSHRAWMAAGIRRPWLPEAPPDPPLTEAMVARLEREIVRLGRPVMGAERSAILRHGIQRLELLATLQGGGGWSGLTDRARPRRPNPAPGSGEPAPPSS